MSSGRLRTFAIGWGALLIVLMGFGTLSPGRIGALTWGPTTDFWAMSIAISNIEFGLKGKLGYREVSQVLADHLTTAKSDMQVDDEGTMKLVQQPDLVTGAMQAAARIKKDDLRVPKDRLALRDWKSTGRFLTTWAEDVGYADFYNMAFRLFGYSSKSTHFLYMLFLASSFAFFLAAYWRENLPLGVVTLGITALFLVSTSILSHPLIPSLAANRFLSTLAIIPLLHIVFATITSRPLVSREIVLLMAQVAMLVLAISFRSSAQWSAIAAVLFASGLGFSRISAPRLRNFRRMLALSSERWRMTVRQPMGKALAGLLTRFVGSSPIVVVPSVVLFGLLLGSVIQRAQLDGVYFTNDLLPHHLVWHSAYIGLTHHPQWPEHLPIKEVAGFRGDAIPFMVSTVYLRDRGIPNVGGAAGNLYRARLHDRVIRSAYIDFLVKNPRYAAELFLFYKPKGFLSLIGFMLTLIPVGAWILASIAVGLGAALIGIGKAKPSGAALSAVGVIFVCSLLPVFWAYPVFFVVADQLWASLLLGMFVITLGISRAANRVRRRSPI